MALGRGCLQRVGNCGTSSGMCLLATSTGAPRGVKGKPDHKVEEAPPRTPAQEKGHRLGIFLTVISALILVFGLGAESNRIAGLGFMGVLSGYWLARLWYWFRSA